MSTDIIEREVAIEAPVDRVWSLITEAEHLGTWFGDAGADIDLRPGGALEVRWEGHTITGVVQTVEPTSRFASLDLPEVDRTSMFAAHTEGWASEVDGDLVNHAARVAA